jgi:hypothetical protein
MAMCKSWCCVVSSHLSGATPFISFVWRYTLPLVCSKMHIIAAVGAKPDSHFHPNFVEDALPAGLLNCTPSKSDRSVHLEVTTFVFTDMERQWLIAQHGLLPRTGAHSKRQYDMRMKYGNKVINRTWHELPSSKIRWIHVSRSKTRHADAEAFIAYESCTTVRQKGCAAWAVES